MKIEIEGKEIKFHELDEYLGAIEAVKARRKAIERETGQGLPHIGNFSISPESAQKNIENMIGTTQIPLGIAGPLRVNGQFAKGNFFIPLATTEGALVASINRGCSVITQSGGATVLILKDEMTRSPAFQLEGVKEVGEFLNWLKENLDKIKEKAEKTTRFGKFQGIEPYVTGNTIYLRFKFTTGDAMGMNMVTIATNKAANWIAKETGAKLVTLSGNMCTDKKPAWINSILGRGKTVVTDVTIPWKTVEQELKTTPKDFVNVNQRKNLGSIRAGSLGFNAHVANIAAAIFAATGQDIAHVVGTSCTITVAEITPQGDLYISVTLPILEVGTVGGGTGLPTQNEALKILGVAGSGTLPGQNSKKFAEIVGAAILAGEISLLSALAAGHLAQAHIKLAR